MLYYMQFVIIGLVCFDLVCQSIRFEQLLYKKTLANLNISQIGAVHNMAAMVMNKNYFRTLLFATIMLAITSYLLNWYGAAGMVIAWFLTSYLISKHAFKFVDIYL